MVFFFNVLDDTNLCLGSRTTESQKNFAILNEEFYKDTIFFFFIFQNFSTLVIDCQCDI